MSSRGTRPWRATPSRRSLCPCQPVRSRARASVPTNPRTVYQRLSLLAADVARCFLKTSRDLTQDDCALFAGLAQEINRAIQSIETPGKKSRGVFVRLNTRSPKDAAIRNSERLYSFLVPEFERITNPEDRNATIVALRRGFGQAMRVTSGEEAMSLLRQYVRPPKLMMDSASPLTRTRHDTLVGPSALLRTFVWHTSSLIVAGHSKSSSDSGTKCRSSTSCAVRWTPPPLSRAR